MKYTISALHKKVTHNYLELLRIESDSKTNTLVSQTPENLHGLCYEYRANEINRPCDILVAYYCSPHNLVHIENYLANIEHISYSKKIMAFVESRRDLELYKSINLVWFSYDWNQDYYPSIPTFYISTQHCNFKNVRYLQDFFIDSTSLLMPAHLNYAKKLAPYLHAVNVNHLGYTFAREKVKTKVVFSIQLKKLVLFLKKISWQGDYQKLNIIINVIEPLNSVVQASISFSDELSKKIELELPWVSTSNENYIDDQFITLVNKICGGENSYDALRLLSNWLDKDLDTSFYTKFSIFEDSSINFKSYLHTSPYQKKSFLK